MKKLKILVSLACMLGVFSFANVSAMENATNLNEEKKEYEQEENKEEQEENKEEKEDEREDEKEEIFDEDEKEEIFDEIDTSSKAKKMRNLLKN